MDDISKAKVSGDTPRVGFLNIMSVVATILALGVFVVITNPTNGGPIVVLTALGILFLLTFQLSYVALLLIGRYTHVSLHKTRRVLLVLLVALGAVFLIGMQTLSQLGIGDIVLVGVFELLTYFYVIRRF